MSSVIVEKDGSIIYRASGLGHCLKGLVAARKGLAPKPFSDDTLKRFAEGNRLEEPILREVASRGYIISDRQLEVNIPITKRVTVRGHIDGIAFDGVQKWVVDAKSASTKSFNTFLTHGMNAFNSYRWQLSVYMIALELSGMMAFKDKGSDENDRDSGRLEVRTYTVPFYTLDDIIDRVMDVEIGAKKPIAFTLCDPGAIKWNCTWNAYHDAEVIPSATNDLASILNPLCEEYVSAVAERTTAENRRKSIAKKIAEAMKKTGLESTDTGPYKIISRPKTYTGKFDEEKIAERLGVPDLERFREPDRVANEPTVNVYQKNGAG